MNSILLSLLVLISFQTLVAWHVTMIDRTSTYPRTRLSAILRPVSGQVWTTKAPSSSSDCTNPGSCASPSLFPTFRDFFSDIEQTLESSRQYSRRLPLDVKETNEFYEVIADVPGVAKEDVKITVKDSVLTISSERKQVERKETDKYRREERFIGSSQRSLSLPENADEDNITAKYENGVLYVQIPKLPETPKNSPKTIEIQ